MIGPSLWICYNSGNDSSKFQTIKQENKREQEVCPQCYKMICCVSNAFLTILKFETQRYHLGKKTIRSPLLLKRPEQLKLRTSTHYPKPIHSPPLCLVSLVSNISKG